MKTNILTSAFLIFCSAVFGQKNKDLDTNSMIAGYVFVASSIKDTTAAGGFGGSLNFPKKLNDSLPFSQKGLFLKIDTAKLVTFSDTFNGYTLYIVNKSNSIVTLDASDSRLSVIAEAYVKNKWQAIENLPSSMCGNSYHKVYLNSNEYWEVAVPKYKGEIKTKIRYKLMLGKDKTIYSNEIPAYINKGQLKEKKDGNPFGSMDSAVK